MNRREEMANTQTEADALKILGKLLETANSKIAPLADTGACVYSAGTKTYCAVLTEANCSKLNGAWTKDGKCP
jgi:hypothetical protein